MIKKNIHEGIPVILSRELTAGERMRASLSRHFPTSSSSVSV
jgi:hypothetical protein